VKVGRTKDPRQRLDNHAKAARTQGHEVSRSWVSPSHGDDVRNEERLIAFCEARWQTVVGREWFESADFDAIVEYASTLPYERVTEAQALEQQERSNAQAERLISALGCQTAAARRHAAVMTELNVLHEKAELIASLANDENRWAACDAAYELTKEAVGLTPAPWAEDDPAAPERYLLARGTAPHLARKNAAEFELNFRALYLIEYRREAESFDDIARFCDRVTGAPTLRVIGGAA
jgi:hypothetical protein